MPCLWNNAQSGIRNHLMHLHHGGGVGTLYEMGKLIDNLRLDYQVIAVATRGHGRSEIGHNPLTYEQKADDIMAVIRKEDCASVSIIGFSDGAYTAYKVASMYPQVIERVVATGAGTLNQGYFKAGTLNVADIEKIDTAFVEQQRQIMPEPERLQEFWTDYMDFWSKISVDKNLFTTIKCPVLLIAGDEDDHAPIVTMKDYERFSLAVYFIVNLGIICLRIMPCRWIVTVWRFATLYIFSLHKIANGSCISFF